MGLIALIFGGFASAIGTNRVFFGLCKCAGFDASVDDLSQWCAECVSCLVRMACQVCYLDQRRDLLLAPRNPETLLSNMWTRIRFLKISLNYRKTAASQLLVTTKIAVLRLLSQWFSTIERLRRSTRIRSMRVWWIPGQRVAELVKFKVVSLSGQCRDNIGVIRTVDDCWSH